VSNNKNDNSNDDKVLGKYSKDELDSLFVVSSKNINWYKKKQSDEKISLLIVDDERSFRELLNEVFSEEGFAVTIAKNGLEGYKEYLKDENNFDIVVTDIMMDTLTGVEMAERIRKKNPMQKMIFISGWFSEEQLINKFEHEFKLGLYIFKTKPLDMVKIIEKIYLIKNQNNSVYDFELNTLDFDEIRSVTEKLTTNQTIALHREIWNLTIKLFLDLLNKKFKRKDLHTLLEPTSKYLKRKGCDEDEIFCRGNECLAESPECVKEKLLTQLKVISELLNKIYKKSSN